MELKMNMRWYVTPAPAGAKGYLLMQTNSPAPIGLFVHSDEAMWVMNRLNAGKRLCIAMGNLLDHDAIINDQANSLVDDAIDALTEYKRDYPQEI